ncbi:MAG: hypothetical protein HYU60_00055 [Magnetospirillum sp.]|nr:hypothetical protein [Magnetospirillum sp.]
MPAAVVAVAAAASAYGAAAGAVALGLVAAESFGAMAIGMLAASLVSMVGNAMLGGKKGGAAPSLNFSYEARENKQMVRQPITAHRLIYGTTKVSGPITFIDTTGNGDYCHLLLTLAGHEVEEIGEVWFNDDLITLSGNAATGKWADHAWVWKGLGTASGDADLWAALRSECTNWTTDHRQSGRAKIYCKFKWDSKLFSSGIPTVRVVIKGRKLADPRTSTTAFSANPALAIRAYLMDTIYGLKATASEIDDASFITP